MTPFSFRPCVSALTLALGLASALSAVPPRVLTLGDAPAESWWHNAVVYEIWPRSFCDSDGDGHGDFRGLTEKLGYLRDLGANAIWLTPIFEAPSYHGYDFEDFYAVESDYGTMADFQAFLAAAHAQEIKVILDLVLNHVSDRHPWFVKSAAREPGYEDYFLWETERPAKWGRAWENTPNPAAVWHWHAGRGQYYYGAFGASQPDLNLRQPAVVAEIHRVASFWLAQGVDGFRLDAVRYALEEVAGGQVDQSDTAATIAFWRDFAAHVKAEAPQALLVAEAWADIATVGRYYDEGRGLDSAFDFDFGYVVTGLLNNVERTADFGSVGGGTGVEGRDALWQNLVARKDQAPLAFYAPFLTNHDQVRVMHALENDVAQAKIAAALLFTSPGTVYLYYGEEIGQGQYRTGDDVYKRDLMRWENTASAGFSDTGRFWLDEARWVPWMTDFQPWWGAYWNGLRATGRHTVAEQRADPDSLWHHYRRLANARRAHPVLASPEELRYFPVAAPNAWFLESRRGDAALLTVVNLDARGSTETAVPEELRGYFEDVLTGRPVTLGKCLSLPPAQAFVLRRQH